MGKLPAFFILFLLALTEGYAQQPTVAVVEPSLKYGKPTNEELSMTTYAPDSSATAVVLYKKSDVNYHYIANDFQLTSTHEVKIKVLKSDGTSYADVVIPYYDNENNSGSKEIVTQIDASSYNLEGGTVMRTKMKKEFIFKERVNSKYMQIKFSIPGVKAGTVLEYKYKTLSDFYFSLESWEAQQDIPVLYGQYDITIPEYFKFNLDMRGSERLESSETAESVNFTVSDRQQTNTIHCIGRHLCFKAHQLPALHTDDYIWCPDDYRTQVTFELQGLDFPGSAYKSYTSTWDQIDEMLLKDSEFGGQLKMRNPFRDEMATLGLDKLPDIQSKVCALFNFLKKKVSWNDHYSIYGDAKKAAKSGTGDNSSINFLLMSMLREANIPAYPVIMSRRNQGIIPYAYPSIQKINTFVVAIPDTDSTYVFIDGSVRHGYLSVLPPVLMVNRARLIQEGNCQWVDLSAIGKHQLRSVVIATVGSDGKICGTRATNYAGQHASHLRSRFHEAKDSTDFVNKLESEESIQVIGIEMKELHAFSPQVKETVTFEKQATVNDNFIYLNPLIFLHTSKNLFIQEERKLPVELPYPDQIILAVTLTLPEGYAIDELPKPVSIVTEDGQGKCIYNLHAKENTVTLNYRFSFNKLLYLPTEYPSLKSFWGTIADKNNEMMVLKKR